ncbi:galactonate dehydratase [Streptomyces sp. KR80]|uniref:galactonate dehydratase n=1 Tax=Streptomyces sp. KR80 TaxID=3457426 RepID=UPI003FD004FA
MKITKVETFPVPPRWLFCKISTDEGIDGWGEPLIEGRSDTVRAAVHELADLLIGRDPLPIEAHWQILTKGGFYRGGPILASAVAGLDQALWDIAGKARGAPVHELLGGPVRDRVRVYSWVGGDEPREIADAIAAQVGNGFTAVKMNACGRMGPIATPAETHEVLARVEVARSILGDHRDLALDFHGRVSVTNAARLLPLLEPYHLLFAEEPVLPEHLPALRRLVPRTSVPLATGERLYSRAEYLPPLLDGIAVVQPDLSHAGGISEVRRIAALAETFDVPLAPHCPLGPIALAASLQTAFSAPNFLIQEQSLGIHYNIGNDLLDYLVDPSIFAFADGHVARPQGSGLGVSIDEAAVRRAAETGHRWRSPVWTHPDGSFAEW